MNQTPDDALRDYAQRRQAERDRLEHERRQKRENMTASERQERAEREKKRTEEVEHYRKLWSEHDPAGKYIRGVARDIEVDEALRRDLIDYIRRTGRTEIAFLRQGPFTGYSSDFVAWKRHVPVDQQYAMIYQIVEDRDLARKRKIAEGPFAGWTFECRPWLTTRFRTEPNCRLVDRRGVLGFVKDLF
nr:hypothetical protein [Pandoravirus massiliensis]